MPGQRFEVAPLQRSADEISLSLSTGCFLTDLAPSTRKEFPTTNETVQEKWFREVAHGGRRIRGRSRLSV